MATPWIIIDDDVDDDDDNIDIVDASLMMLTGTQNSGVRGGCTMILAGAILCEGVCILVNTSATHNVIDTNTAQLIGLAEWRITTTVLVGSGTEFAYRGACFNIPLRIDADTF